MSAVGELGEGDVGGLPRLEDWGRVSEKGLRREGAAGSGEERESFGHSGGLEELDGFNYWMLQVTRCQKGGGGYFGMGSSRYIFMSLTSEIECRGAALQIPASPSLSRR